MPLMRDYTHHSRPILMISSKFLRVLSRQSTRSIITMRIMQIWRHLQNSSCRFTVMKILSWLENYKVILLDSLYVFQVSSRRLARAQSEPENAFTNAQTADTIRLWRWILAYLEQQHHCIVKMQEWLDQIDNHALWTLTNWALRNQSFVINKFWSSKKHPNSSQPVRCQETLC